MPSSDIMPSEGGMITVVKLRYHIGDLELSQLIFCGFNMVGKVEANKGKLTEVSHQRLEQLYNGQGLSKKKRG